MWCIMDNIALNLCRGGLQQVGEAERLEVALPEDEIVYQWCFRDTGSSMSWGNVGPPQTYMNITDFSSSQTSCVPDPSTSAPGLP